MREFLLPKVAVVLCLSIVLSGCTETHKVTETTLAQDLNARMSERFPITEFNFKNLRGHVFEDGEVDSYQLSIVPADLTGHDALAFSFGQFITFGEQDFVANNCTMCGNDVQILTTGNWRWVAENQIEVYVESIERNEYCSQPSEQPKSVLGVFELAWLDADKTRLQMQRPSND